ncbi:MAG: TRAP transporter small permease subunit [Dehalococcoidia bacterium]|nr:TRAP transporter small permease subunit [Dehalococcoidia bacterium]MDW8119204.1 TRAP transporter small permease subunit [Chloroflexota bacterium]
MERLLRVTKVIDTIGEWIGKTFAWLIIPLVGVMTYEVISRKFFGSPTVWSYDITYMLYGSIFMLGAGYTLLKKGHIRTDIFYNRFPVRVQGTIDAVLYLLFFFPGMAFFLWAGWDEAWHAFTIREKSDASPWRPPLYPYKFVIPATAALLIVQGVSEFLKSVYAMLKGRWP